MKPRYAPISRGFWSLVRPFAGHPGASWRAMASLAYLVPVSLVPVSLVRPSGATLPLARERRATGHPGASCFAMASLAYLVRPSGLPGEPGLLGPCLARAGLPCLSRASFLVPVWRGASRGFPASRVSTFLARDGDRVQPRRADGPYEPRSSVRRKASTEHVPSRPSCPVEAPIRADFARYLAITKYRITLLCE